MSHAFDYAWSVLKADPSQQIVQPEMVYGESPYAPSQSIDGMSYRFMPQGTMHQAIGGMMQRQGIQQPAPGQLTRNEDWRKQTIEDVPNPVKRMGGSNLQPQPIQAAPTGPSKIAQRLAQVIPNHPLNQPIATPPTDLTPYQNVMQAM